VKGFREGGLFFIYGVHPKSHPFAPAIVPPDEGGEGGVLRNWERDHFRLFLLRELDALSPHPSDLRRCRIPAHAPAMTSVAMAPRHAQKPNRVLIDAAKRMVSKYRLGYLPQDKAFDLLAFVRFLYFLARKRAMAFCAAISQEYPSRKELCQQCGAFFYQHRSCIGFLRVLGFCRCPRRCLSINRILSLASSQACALVCVGGFGASEGQHSAGSAPPRRQAPIQGAWAHGLQDDLDANLGG